jgi:hypothetical protein
MQERTLKNLHHLGLLPETLQARAPVGLRLLHRLTAKGDVRKGGEFVLGRLVGVQGGLDDGLRVLSPVLARLDRTLLAMLGLGWHDGGQRLGAAPPEASSLGRHHNMLRRLEQARLPLYLVPQLRQLHQHCPLIVSVNALGIDHVAHQAAQLAENGQKKNSVKRR